MANESTLALISSLIPSIWEAALMYAQQNLVMPNLVTTFTDSEGWEDRKVTEYAAGTVVKDLAETDDLANMTQAVSRSLLSTLSPAEAGTQYFVTDRRLKTDPEDVAADIAEKVGYEMFLQVESDLIGDFGSVTLGTIGTAGGTLSWKHLFAARARLAANGVPGPYTCVLHEYQWYHLATAANIAGIASAGPLKIRDDIQSRYYVASTSDIDFYVTGVPTAGTAVRSAMFNRAALALDIRQGLRIEPDRKPSRRGHELNVTMVYAHGVWRPARGIQLIGDASEPDGA